MSTTGSSDTNILGVILSIMDIDDRPCYYREKRSARGRRNAADKLEACHHDDWVAQGNESGNRVDHVDDNHCYPKLTRVLRRCRSTAMVTTLNSRTNNCYPYCRACVQLAELDHQRQFNIKPKCRGGRKSRSRNRRPCNRRVRDNRSRGRRSHYRRSRSRRSGVTKAKSRIQRRHSSALFITKSAHGSRSVVSIKLDPKTSSRLLSKISEERSSVGSCSVGSYDSFPFNRSQPMITSKK